MTVPIDLFEYGFDVLVDVCVDHEGLDQSLKLFAFGYGAAAVRLMITEDIG